MGIDFVHAANGEPWPENPTGILDFAGVGIADLDGDQALDLFFSSAAGTDGIYLSGGLIGQYTRRERGGIPAHTNAVFLLDVDGDGDRDAAVTTLEDPYLLINDGDGNFGQAALLNTNPVLRDDLFYASFSISAGDLNGDGWVDLVVSNHLVFEGDGAPGFPARQWLMLNQQDGTFKDMSELLPKHALYDWTFLTSLTDFDNDGDLDLYVVNDTWSLAERGVGTDTTRIGSRLYRNDGTDDSGPIITDVSEGSGADVELSGMGVAIGDYDNDGWMDAYQSSATPFPHALLRNKGDLQFEDTTDAAGAQTLAKDRTVGWGTIFFDADSDGWEDLFVTHGPAPDKPDLGGGVPNQPNVLMRNQGGAAFEEVTAGVEGKAISRSPAVGDLNRDGFPDLVVANTGVAPYVYLNGCDGRPWLTVRLDNTGPNGDAIGARIRATGGGLTQQRQIQVGSDGLYGSSAPEAYFGFPSGTDSIALSVQWPDGPISAFDVVETRRLVTISRQ
ncbi:MAG: hypothetical protein ACI9WU_003023 [Myxococcota bacterium]|jgi:hypothetical protein